MEPICRQKATLVDLLDRVLDRGLILQADLIISVAEVPLIGVSLHAAIAGIETMIKYGYLNGWDREIRKKAKKRAADSQPLRAKDQNNADNQPLTAKDQNNNDSECN